MTRFELVIAGGGLTAARAIESFRDAGRRGRVALLSQESVLPPADAVSREAVGGRSR